MQSEQHVASLTVVDAPLLLVKSDPAGHAVEPEPVPPTYSLLHVPPQQPIILEKAN